MSYTIPTELYTYLARLVEEAHGQDVAEDLKSQIIQDLFGRLQNHMLTSFVQALPDEYSDAFSTFMMSSPDEAAVQEFFEKHIPNYPEVVANSLLEFRDVYVGAAKS